MATTNPTKSTEISGRWVVACMLAFGVSATGSLWVYWQVRTADFRELQEALAAEFPGSRPRADGGQRRMLENTPRILRIVLGVEFDPTVDDRAVDAMVHRVSNVARRSHNLAGYHHLELHLYWLVPEKEIKQRMVTVDVAEGEPSEKF